MHGRAHVCVAVVWVGVVLEKELDDIGLVVFDLVCFFLCFEIVF